MIFILALGLVLFGSYLISKKYEKQTTSITKKDIALSAKEDLPVITLKDSFYAKSLFFESVDAAKESKSSSSTFALISPHHFVAAKFIAEIIKTSSGRDIKTVVIVGPNHDNIGAEMITSTKSAWETPFGRVAVDENLTGLFLADFNLVANNDAFQNEHSIGAIVPFIKYYIPQAKIIPIILSSYAGQKEADNVSQWIADNAPEGSLVVFSMDFSHYLTKEIADTKDDLTEKLILNREIEKALNLTNDNVDCPACLATSLMYAQKKSLSTEIVRNGNSFDFSFEKPSRTTSYFTVSKSNI